MLRKVILFLTLAFLLCLTSCTTAQEGRLPIGVVDLPRANDVLKGHQVFFGWAVSEDGIKSVEVYVDRDFLAYAKVGVSRPDVNKTIPGFPSGDNAGWRLEIESQGLPAGAHQLVFEAKTGAGVTGCLGARQVTIVH